MEQEEAPPFIAQEAKKKAEKPKENPNVKLWESVCKTDPAHTKPFQKGGGFSGTAIKPFWLIRRATETFGVVGIGWGWQEIENKSIAGVWCSKVRLWYMVDGKRGEIEQWGQTVMEGTNKKGNFVDEEAPKKAVTDAVTKCLSYLGFAGDVHMGLFDDSKYVDERKKEEAAKPETAKDIYESQAAMKRKFAAICEEINTAGSYEMLATVWKENNTHILAMKKIDEAIYGELVKIKDKRKKDIADKMAEVAAFGQGFNEVRDHEQR